MNICFIADAWESMNPEIESTLRMIHESVKRGHRVCICKPGNLTIRENVSYAFCRILSFDGKIPDSISSFYKRTNLKKQMLPLNGFDVIFIRKNPPLDNVMLNFLDSVKNDVFIVNDIDGLRKASNKIYVTSFEDAHEFIPETYVSRDVDYLESVINNSKNDKMILKPLDGYGGSGVIILETKAKASIKSLLDFYIGEDKNYVMLQEYIEGADKGDIRIMMLNGEPIGAMKRVPQGSDARSNIHAGGKAEKYTLNKKELELCRKIGQQLVVDGIYFAGLDIIEGKLLEVNVLSPGGITRINKFNKTNLQRKIIDFVEIIYKKREDAVARRYAFKKAIEDA